VIERPCHHRHAVTSDLDQDSGSEIGECWGAVCVTGALRFEGQISRKVEVGFLLRTIIAGVALMLQEKPDVAT
jgi:hypothetical protein